MSKTIKETGLTKNVALYSTYLLLVWGAYRAFVSLPENIEELLVKPLIWLVPVALLLRKEKVGAGSLGLTFKNLFPAIYFSLALGAFFVMEAVLINFVKHGGLNFGSYIGEGAFFSSLFLSFATATVEETSFRGYIFSRLWLVTKKEWVATLLTSLLWGLIHVPVVIFVWKLSFSAGLTYLILTTIFGIGSAFVFARTRNIFSSILLHVLWEWPIILFR